MSNASTQLHHAIMYSDRVCELVEARLGQKISKQQVERLGNTPNSGFPRCERVGKKSPAFFSREAVENFIAAKLKAIGVEPEVEREELETWFDGEPPDRSILPPFDWPPTDTEDA